GWGGKSETWLADSSRSQKFTFPANFKAQQEDNCTIIIQVRGKKIDWNPMMVLRIRTANGHEENVATESISFREDDGELAHVFYIRLPKLPDIPAPAPAA